MAGVLLSLAVAAAAESGGWEAAARVAREGPLMTPLKPALQECLECRIALLRAPATPPPARARSPFCDLRLEEIVLADLRHPGLCPAEAALSACSVRRGTKRQRLEPPLVPRAPAALASAAALDLPGTPTAASAAWAALDKELEQEEEEATEGCSELGMDESCGDDDLEDDAQSTSPTFSFQAWPEPRRAAARRAGSVESVAGGLGCSQSVVQA